MLGRRSCCSSLGETLALLGDVHRQVNAKVKKAGSKAVTRVALRQPAQDVLCLGRARFEVYAGLERSAEHIGFNTLHAALSALPVQVERRHPDAPPARGVRDVVRDQLTDQMRALAEAIRTGSADFAGNQPLSAPEARDAIVIAEREVVLREPILYVGLDRRPVQVCGAVRLPEPVALAALEQGIGHEPGTPEAQDILRGLEQGNTSYGYLDIGVDLAEVVAQERQCLAEKAAA